MSSSSSPSLADGSGSLAFRSPLSPSLIFCFFSLSAPFHLSFLPFLYYCFAAAPVLDANTLFTSAYTFSGSLSASIFATFPFFS